MIYYLTGILRDCLGSNPALSAMNNIHGVIIENMEKGSNKMCDLTIVGKQKKR